MMILLQTDRERLALLVSNSSGFYQALACIYKVQISIKLRYVFTNNKFLPGHHVTLYHGVTLGAT